MKRLLLSLYDDADTATDVMRALHDEGFKSSEIECIESPPDEEHLYRRPLFTDGQGEIIRAESARRALANTGIPKEDTGEYVDAIRSGRSLVVLRCEEGRAPVARDVMNRVPTERAIEAQTGQSAPVPEPPSQQSQQASPRTEAPDELERPGDTEILERLAKKYGDDEWLRSDAPTRPPQKSLEGLPVDEPPPREFAELEPQFRRHYREHFAANTSYSFRECATAYRFGLALGDELGDETDWTNIEPEAARQWQDTDNPPWEAIGDAVRFGWAIARGEEEQYRSRPRNP